MFDWLKYTHVIIIVHAYTLLLEKWPAKFLGYLKQPTNSAYFVNVNLNPAQSCKNEGIGRDQGAAGPCGYVLRYKFLQF